MAVPEHYPLTLTVIGKAHILVGDMTGLTETLKDDMLKLISRLAIPDNNQPEPPPSPPRPRFHRRRSSKLNYSGTQILRAMGEYNAEITLNRLSDMTGLKTSTVSPVLTLLIGRTMATRKALGVYEITERGREYLQANPPPARGTPPPPPPYVRHDDPPPPPVEPVNPWPKPALAGFKTRQDTLKPLGRPTAHDQEP